jgi:hypothetical protein
VTGKPTTPEDASPTPTPVTKKSTGSFAVAEQNAHWSREIAAAARARMRDLTPALGRRDIAEGAVLRDLAARATALSHRFERWTSGAVVNGEMVPMRKSDEERMTDLAAYGALVADAAKVGVKPF